MSEHHATRRRTQCDDTTTDYEGVSLRQPMSIMDNPVRFACPHAKPCWQPPIALTVVIAPTHLRISSSGRST